MEDIAMKKIYYAFLCAACAIVLFSCQKEVNAPDNDNPVVPSEQLIPEGYSQLTLSAVSDETKTTLDGATVKWAAGDEIKVYCNDASASDFTLIGAGGSATGDFSGLVPSGKTALYAVYPKDLYSSVSGTTVNVTIPDAQEGTFGEGNIAVAKVDSENNMAFKNVNAFVGFTVPADITKVIVSSVGGEDLSGTLAVDCSGDPAAGTLSSGGSSITVTFPVNTGGTYYVAIAPGITHSKGLLLTWYKDADVSGTYWLNKAITTAANTIIDMETVSADGKYYVTVDGAGKKNGMNWDNAWSAAQFWSKLHPAGTDVQMDNAKLSNINKATFYLAAGTYKWGAGAEINIDDATFGQVAFTVEGGYDASTGARDIANNATIFTGDDDDDNTGDHRILTLDGNMNLVFDGITFTEGLSNGSGDARFAGAIWIKAGSHSFVDCTFTENSAVFGGAIRFDSTGDLTLTGTEFSNNSATGDAGALSLGSGKITVSGCTFTDNTAPVGGAIDCFGTSVLSILGGVFSNNTAVNNGGAIAVESGATLKVNQSGTSSTSFIGNSSTKYGGALDIETSKASIDNKIKNAIFKGNHAHDGGAVAIDGEIGTTTKVYFDNCTFGGTGSGEPNYVKTSSSVSGSSYGGAILVENDSFVNISSSSFIGNYANNNQYGGAFCAKGDSYVNLFSDSFIGNYAGTGGVAFTQKATIKSKDYYPRLFVDECSFDANYITKNYGCVFNISGASHFIMHNSSVKGSYITASETGEKACWIDLDGIQGCTSISNCSIIGDNVNTALVWSCNGSWTNYFTNNIIIPEGTSQKSIHTDGAALDLSYNYYYSATPFTDNGGNVIGVLSSDVDGLIWEDDCWKWDGTFGGVAPSKTNKDYVTSRVNSASSDFVSWSGSDFNKDQRGVGRGNGDWWPGAYQSN